MQLFSLVLRGFFPLPQIKMEKSDLATRDYCSVALQVNICDIEVLLFITCAFVYNIMFTCVLPNGMNGQSGRFIVSI